MWSTEGKLMEENSSNDCILVSTNLVSRNKRFETDSFEFPNEDDEDVQFDTSDAAENGGVLMAGRQYPSVQEFASAIPNHLLLGSLLEHLCFVYEKDPHRSRMLFKVIGQRLAAMNLLSPLALSDEFSTVRLQHNRAFTELLQAASRSLFPQEHRYLNSDAQSLKTSCKDGFFQTSRYLSEFEEICRLGKGAYGKVFKVRNKLDSQNYAVKKILIKSVSREDCMKVLREVKVLSSLQHANIVGYHTAWMEHVQPSANSQKSIVSNLPALKTSSLKTCTRTSFGSCDSSSIVFESSDRQDVKMQDSLKEDVALKGAEVSLARPEQSQAVCPKGKQSLENAVPCVFLGGPRTAAPESCPVTNWDSSLKMEGDTGRSRLELNDNSDVDGSQRAGRRLQEVQFHLMLYIQMQLCELSLRDWILERNGRMREEQASPADPYKHMDTIKAFSIFQAILEGVQYIHSRGIMHRDLKPRNIFLYGPDYDVKIGDFGLACQDIIVDTCEHSSIVGSSHTTGVGTLVYAAPEQLQGSHYDSKSDMYSVGIVALELFQPFGTEMERVRTLEQVRHRKFPHELSMQWPALGNCISLLTSPEPFHRPSAAHLLQSDLFNSPNKIIHSLQKKVEEQEEEIVQLKKQISELQITQSTQS